MDRRSECVQLMTTNGWMTNEQKKITQSILIYSFCNKIYYLILFWIHLSVRWVEYIGTKCGSLLACSLNQFCVNLSHILIGSTYTHKYKPYWRAYNFHACRNQSMTAVVAAAGLCRRQNVLISQERKQNTCRAILRFVRKHVFDTRSNDNSIWCLMV